MFEIIIVTIIVVFAVGLTARAFYRKLSLRSGKNACGEGCPSADCCSIIDRDTNGTVLPKDTNILLK